MLEEGSICFFTPQITMVIGLGWAQVRSPEFQEPSSSTCVWHELHICASWICLSRKSELAIEPWHSIMGCRSLNYWAEWPSHAAFLTFIDFFYLLIEKE